MKKIIKTLSLALLVYIPMAYGMENNAIVPVGSEQLIISDPSESFTMNGVSIPNEILYKIFCTFYEHCSLNQLINYYDYLTRQYNYPTISMEDIPNYVHLRDLFRLKSTCKAFYHMSSYETIGQITQSTNDDISKALVFHKNELWNKKRNELSKKLDRASERHLYLAITVFFVSFITIMDAFPHIKDNFEQLATKEFINALVEKIIASATTSNCTIF